MFMKNKKSHCEYASVCPYYADDSFTCNDEKSNLSYCGKYNLFCDLKLTPKRLVNLIRKLLGDYLDKKYG